jgi:hypothetical protein
MDGGFMEETHSLHVKVPDKFRQLAFEQGIPEAAMITRSLTAHYAGKISNKEAILNLQMGLAKILSELELEQPNPQEIKKAVYACHDVITAMVVWEG